MLPSPTQDQIFGLPVEVFDHCLYHLLHDKRSLATCTLVCHAWKSRSRRLLFSSFSLDSQMDLQAFYQRVSERTDLASLVRSIEFRGFPTRPINIVISATLPRVLSSLKQLQSLTVADCDFSRNIFDLPGWRFIRNNLVISELTILHTNMVKIHLSSIITAFPHLKHFTLDFAGCGYSQEPQLAFDRTMNLESLTIARMSAVSSGSDASLDIVSSLSTIASARRFRCSIATREEALALKNFLRVTRVDIMYLEIKASLALCA